MRVAVNDSAQSLTGDRLEVDRLDGRDAAVDGAASDGRHMCLTF
jgi:hypothetical protein